MKRLWLTYVCRDQLEDAFDDLIHQLDQTNLDVRYDLRQIIPGQRLWYQIGRHITNPKECDAWGILLTTQSIASKLCVDEIEYALAWAQESTNDTFPIFFLLHHVDPKDIPTSLKMVFAISTKDRNWLGRVLAAINGASPGKALKGVPDFVLHEYLTTAGYCLEIRPAFESIAPFAVAVDYREKASGNVSHCYIGPAGRIPTGHTAYHWVDTASNLSDGSLVWVWSADNEASPTFAFYLFYRNRPERVWFGPHKRLRMLTSWSTKEKSPDEEAE
jgi:hypothetical protein